VISGKGWRCMWVVLLHAKEALAQAHFTLPCVAKGLMKSVP